MLTLCFLAQVAPGDTRIVARAMEVEALACRAHDQLPPPRDYDGVMDTAAVFLQVFGHNRIYVADHTARVPLGD